MKIVKEKNIVMNKTSTISIPYGAEFLWLFSMEGSLIGSRGIFHYTNIKRRKIKPFQFVLSLLNVGRVLRGDRWMGIFSEGRFMRNKKRKNINSDSLCARYFSALKLSFSREKAITMSEKFMLKTDG